MEGVPRWAGFAAAAAACLLAVVLALGAGAFAAAVFAALAPVIMFAAVLPELRSGASSKMNRTLVTKATQQVEAGRKLVIYERETGLLAHWYIQLRCDEECQRAGRYKHPLALVAIEPTAESDVWTVQDDVANWLRWRLRHSDLAAYVGNACYVVLMPETDAAGAEKLIGRLRSDIETVDVGISTFSDDGKDFDQLLAEARSRLGKAVQSAA